MKLNNKRRKLSEIRQINTLRKIGKVKSFVKITNDVLDDEIEVEKIINDNKNIGLPRRVQRRFSYQLIGVEIGLCDDDFAKDLRTIKRTHKAVEL